ncbi:MAG: Ig-like domain-containing protein [Dysgonamonadaceae bacterium]|jgi:uncharacterized protein YjdB|nr:Ig-like domain-containing protein [Dysgonamonadaceae bacterium]
MKKSIKYHLIGLLLCLTPFISKAETTPAWEYDPYSFQYDLSMYISIHQKGVEVEQWDNLVVGAFCGDECRGIATVNQVPDGPHYYYLRVKSNSSQGETISFKCFDKQANKEIDFEETIVFENLKMFGYPSDPYILNLPFISVTGVSLNKTQLTLKTTETETLIATITPDDATNKNVQWSSDNESVATVDQTGKVTAIKAGTAIITVTTEDESLTANCEVTVIQPVTGITLNKNSLTLNTPLSETLVATILPDDVSDKRIEWSSSNEAIATVSANGLVTAIKAGTAIITVKTVDGNYTATCNVTILQPVTGVILNKTELILNKLQSETLIATVQPSDASNKNVSWSSNNETVAIVDQTGKIDALTTGTAVISVTTEDGGFIADCQLTVIQPVTGVTLNKTELTLNTTETEILIATVNPSDASNKTVSWTSNNESVATIDQTGKITALKAGTAIVKVTTEDGEFTATCQITVLQPITGISLNKTELTLNVKLSETLLATVLPQDASNKQVQWSCDNEDVAVVDQTGQVTAVKIGTAIITATTVDGNHTATCNVTVIQLPTGIYLNKTELTLNVQEEETLEVIAEPEDAQYNLIWSCLDETIATVDQTGKVKALKVGATTIIVKTETENFTASCALTVLQPVTGISLNKSEIQLEEGQSEVLIATVLPNDASDKTVKWESLDENVAIVDQDGKVTAIVKGTSIITVTTEDGGFTASCKIEVILPTDLDFAERENIIIFPAEMKDSYYIKNLPEGAIINIIDLNGITVKTLKSTEKSIQLVSLNNLPQGTYFIRIKSKNNFVVVKKVLNPHSR